MKFLHTMLRVTDLDKSINFYTNVMGMSLLRKVEHVGQDYTLVYLAYDEGNMSGQAEIELTYNHGVHEYEHGNAYGHIAIETDEIYKFCDRIRTAGGNIIRDAGPVKGGDTIIAFIQDPDGYKIELIQSSGS